MGMMAKKIIFVIIILALAISAIFIIKSGIFNSEIKSNVLLESIKQIETQIFTPPPLKSEVRALKPFLSRSGVINRTNAQRQEYGLLPLKESSQLDYSAEIKVEDMFARQYFEHISLTQVGVDGLAKEAGYEYILIGENLAMGNFENNEKLVEAWMNSEGHRENILNSKFQEIGVAVMEGLYNGEKIWMAVQHFALPISYCPKPNESLRFEIESGQSQIEQIRTRMETLYAALNKRKPKTKEGIDEYNQMVAEYNSILGQYNLLVEENRKLIDNYNNQVNLFNQCLQI
jgi:uncharacterized protein YkwD